MTEILEVLKMLELDSLQNYHYYKRQGNEEKAQKELIKSRVYQEVIWLITDEQFRKEIKDSLK